MGVTNLLYCVTFVTSKGVLRTTSVGMGGLPIKQECHVV